MATTAGAKKGLWSTIRRIAASDRISGLIMLGFALTGLVLANLPATAHAFETVAETHLFIPYTISTCLLATGPRMVCLPSSS